eukprot:13676-Heterococcus_DN1.PRE.2
MRDCSVQAAATQERRYAATCVAPHCVLLACCFIYATANTASSTSSLACADVGGACSVLAHRAQSCSVYVE